MVPSYDKIKLIKIWLFIRYFNKWMQVLQKKPSDFIYTFRWNLFVLQ